MSKIKTPGVDVLSERLTSEKGVSDVGIEVRRGDTKQKGVVSHGYGRVFEDPKKHMERAKSTLKNIIGHMKKQPKLKLPKNEQECDKEVLKKQTSKEIMHQIRLSNEKKRIRNVVSWYLSNNKPLQSKSIILPTDHPLRNDLISDNDRVSLFHDVIREIKPKSLQIIQNHHSASSFPLTLPKNLNIEIKETKTEPPKQTEPKKELVNRWGYGGYFMPKPKSLLQKTSIDALKKLVALKKVDPKTKLPGNLLSKKAAPGVDKEKFDSCVEQVKQKQGDKVNPYAVCNASLKKYGGLNKDDKPHPKGSPEEKAHAIIEEGASAPKAIKELEEQKNPESLKRFWDHLSMLKDKKHWRSPKNKPSK